MKKYLLLLLIAALVVPAMAASTFCAITNEIGYQGTIWNTTDGTGPWATHTPRDASLYTTIGVPGFANDYNYLMSNWSQHSASNKNDSFLQLGETDNPSVTSASGGWDSTGKVFTVNVSGQNAPYPWSRMWQPDNGVAWGVTFTDYTYSFTATFSQQAVLGTDGWLWNPVAPDTITGSFSGQFVVTADVDKHPITNGDLYGFNIGFSKTLFDPLNTLDAYGNPTGIDNYFGAPVPAPGAILLAGLGAGLVGWLRRRRSL